MQGTESANSELFKEFCNEAEIKKKEFFNYTNQKNFLNIFSLSNFQVKLNFNFTCQFTGFKPVFQVQTKFNLDILTTFSHKFLNQKFWLNLNCFSNNFLLVLFLFAMSIIYDFSKFFSKLINASVLII